MTDNHGYKDSAFASGMAFANRLAGFKDTLDWLGSAAGLAMTRRSGWPERCSTLSATLRTAVAGRR